jgi:WD40 repeat protein/serine/threonine protein kinase
MSHDSPSPETIFGRAIAMASPAERSAFLNQACGDDPELRREIEKLVMDHFRAGHFLEQPAIPVGATADNPISEGPGTLIGPYKLLQEIAEGGFGTVFMAEQEHPVRRKVALKVIKAGMDTRQIIARFEAERQALAMMDHVNIARVFDGGATEAGRPYFVMELVHGIPITKYCDDKRLTPRERLELFVPVCQAIQHAHQKGIIHRDIKPSNVMVTLYDGKPVPKVIDFGVAKATEQKLTERTLFTQYGTMVGTLEYMSPEQAEMSALGVDTRSDIYSLGVLLYELLTGSTPLSHKRLKEAAYAEILRMIKEEEPPKPSTRLSDSGEALASISAQRKTEPAKLTKLVRGELDWIVMKCLEKDRNRRYETANAFAADVQHYLYDEPVLACPPSAGYRLKKFIRRNKGPVLAGTLVLLVLVGGIVGTTCGLVEAWRQRDLTEQARKDEAEQRLEAVANAEKAKEEEEKAKTARVEAERLARDEKAARNRAEWLLYASQITLAQQAWEDDNAFLAFHYLEACRTEFRGWEHDYLFTLFNSNRHTTFRGHTTSVNSVALSPDGKRIVSGGGDNTVRVWDVDTGQNTLTLKGHTDVVDRVALSVDGKRIVSASEDKTVKAWDADTGQNTLTLRGHTGAVNGVAFSPDGKRIVSASSDKTIKVWDAVTGDQIRTLKGHTDGVSSVAVSPDGKRIVSCSMDKTMKVWDAATGDEIRTLKDTAEVFGLALSANGKRIVSCSLGRTAQLWDVDTGQNILTLKGHNDTIISLALSVDGKRIISGCADGTVKVWDAATGQELRTLKGHTFYVTGVAVSPDGKRIVSCSADKTIKVWDATGAEETPPLKPPADVNFGMALGPDGKRIVNGRRDGTVKVWDASSGQETLTLKGHTGPVIIVAFSADGNRIVSSDDKTVKVWDAATGQETLTLKGHTSPVRSVALSLDQQRVVSVSADGTVKVGDRARGEETRSLQGYERSPQSKDHVTCVALSPDATLVVGGTNDGMVKVWNVDTGQNTLTLKGHSDRIYSVAMSFDGKRIVSGSADKTIKLWDATTGDEILTLKGHTAAVLSVGLMPDGKRILSFSYDRTVKLWEATTGHETLTLKGVLLAVSLEGKCILGGRPYGPPKIWDASMSQQKP